MKKDGQKTKRQTDKKEKKKKKEKRKKKPESDEEKEEKEKKITGKTNKGPARKFSLILNSLNFKLFYYKKESFINFIFISSS